MSYAKMMGTMRRNPHCFGATALKAGRCNPPCPPGQKCKFVTDQSGDPLGMGGGFKCVSSSSSRSTPQFRMRAASRGNQFPGGGKNKKPVLINRRGLSPMQRRNEQGLRKVKAR